MNGWNTSQKHRFYLDPRPRWDPMASPIAFPAINLAGKLFFPRDNHSFVLESKPMGFIPGCNPAHSWRGALEELCPFSAGPFSVFSQSFSFSAR
jgi:hypothetical protein